MITRFLLLILILFLLPPHPLVAQQSVRQSQETKTAKEFAREFYEKAGNLMGQKKYREAIESYTAAIGLDSDYPIAYVGRGNAKCWLENWREAIEDYDKAIRIYSSWGPEKPKVKAGEEVNAGEANGNVSIEEFERTLSKAGEASSALGNVYFRRGLAKEVLGDKVGACIDYRESCQWDGLNCGYYSEVCNNESVKPRTTPDASKAQRQSVSSGLDGTKWQAIHPGEIYSPILDRSLSRQFFCSFEKQGKVSCSVIARMSSKIKNEQYYDPIERRVKYRQVLIPSMTLPEENRVGTYKQNGNSIHIELSAYEIEATVEGDGMSGSITFKLESNQQARWVAKRITGEN